MAEKRQIIITSDGSPTIWDPLFNETFHSRHGAIQESEWVFIKNGLKFQLDLKPLKLRILEVGLGTGLNVLLTVNAMKSLNVNLMYDAIELFPLEEEILAGCRSDLAIRGDEMIRWFDLIHKSRWEEEKEISRNIFLRKMKCDAITCVMPADYYDIIYFDAFSPASQPEMWSDAMLSKMASTLSAGGILVTYCAKGDVKRRLRDAGLTVVRLPGPPGKRHIIRALKNTKNLVDLLNF